MTKLNLLPQTEEDYERAALEYFHRLPLEHFMEATPHATQREITVESMALLRARRPEVQVFNELLVQYPYEGELRQIVPDNMLVVCKEPARAEGSFNLPFEPARPFLVFEYVSRTDPSKDYRVSFGKYEKELKIPYCLLFYPRRRDFRVYRLGARRYKLVKPNAAGRFAIPELDLEVGLRDDWVRFWYRGQLLELPGELQQRLTATQQQLDLAKTEIERLRALVEQLSRKK